MDKFQNKYRIPSHRKPGWDYSCNGMYFITFVTQHRSFCLGEIRSGVMLLSDFGKIVQQEWLKSFEIRCELFLDEYVIMPNHVHAIIILDNDEKTNNGDCIATNDGKMNDGGTRDGTHVGGTRDDRDARPCDSTNVNAKKSAPSTNCIRQPKSISSFVGGFKSTINTKIDDYIDDHELKITKYNKNNHFFQPNYHDHIIRDEMEYFRIKNYIIQNPSKWEDDSLKIL